jgi:Membrane bound beta barrel domain (DUF5777)
VTRHLLLASVFVVAGPWPSSAHPGAWGAARWTSSAAAGFGSASGVAMTPTPGTQTEQPVSVPSAANDSEKGAAPEQSDDKTRKGGTGSEGDAASGSPADDGGEAPPADAAPAQKERDDAVLDRAQPDFTVITLPTTLRVPKYRSAFRVTHRFARPLGQGDFGDLLEDFFGFDASALIGLEFRFGLFPGTQVGIYRTSDKTIEFFGQYDVVSQSDTFPLGLAAFASVDGTNNFKDSYSPAVGLIVSRKLGDVAALYVEPFWVNNTNVLPSEIVDDNDTFFLGLGGRVRVRPTVYLVGEFIPRVAGYDPGVHGGNFGIEKRVGGHSFQLNFSNFLGTTMGQIARGGLSNDDWYIGFNITRKFF